MLASFRFAIPLVLLSAVAARRYVTGGESVATSMALFSFLPKDQFLAAVGGFLSYRIPLLFTEVMTKKNRMSHVFAPFFILLLFSV